MGPVWQPLIGSSSLKPLGTQLVLSGSQNRTLWPCLAAMAQDRYFSDGEACVPPSTSAGHSLIMDCIGNGGFSTPRCLGMLVNGHCLPGKEAAVPRCYSLHRSTKCGVYFCQRVVITTETNRSYLVLIGMQTSYLACRLGNFGPYLAAISGILVLVMDVEEVMRG
jgi:hypothetical protein